VTLILHDLTPYHWAIGGAGIGVVVLLLLYLGNRRLGISTGFEDLCAVAVDAPYFKRRERSEGAAWRVPFLGGLLAGGALSAALSGGWAPTWDLGLFDTAIGWGPAGKVVWMFAGGLLIGFGTRMAGGCTSGHGIFGLANFEKAGLAATLSFMAAGVVTAHLVYGVIFTIPGA
jgi:hypothetical protein